MSAPITSSINVRAKPLENPFVRTAKPAAPTTREARERANHKFWQDILARRQKRNARIQLQAAAARRRELVRRREDKRERLIGIVDKFLGETLPARMRTLTPENGWEAGDKMRWMAGSIMIFGTVRIVWQRWDPDSEDFADEEVTKRVEETWKSFGRKTDGEEEEDEDMYGEDEDDNENGEVESQEDKSEEDES